MPASPKPYKGQHAEERSKRKAAKLSARVANKLSAKQRDGYKCRWPHRCKPGSTRLESAHLVNLSQGGTDETSNLITLCVGAHQGRRSLHSQDKQIDPLTGRGADGPCAFYERDESGKFVHIASEKR